MDPVDVITMSVMAAQFIRSAADPSAVIAGAYGVLDREPPTDRDEAIAVRVVRLMDDAGDRRRDVLDYLRTHSGRLPLNRTPATGDGTTLADPEPEATRLAALVSIPEVEEKALSIIPEGQGPFTIAERSVVTSFDREEIEHSGPLPTTVRGLIDYPLKVPVLFEIETGEEPWDVWKILCAFADEYVKVYENAERYGVWGHDITDLWIDGLAYLPDERLIYLYMSS